jgi:hypothetical protein
MIFGQGIQERIGLIYSRAHSILLKITRTINSPFSTAMLSIVLIHRVPSFAQLIQFNMAVFQKTSIRL